MRFVSRAAYGRKFHLKIQVQGLEHSDGLFHDFGADAVTG